ncbi:hypothetical protein DAPPUDRAFT_315729 [Daphnia pulex]|uniref:PH domain-containing protein n=1 Tax=Daphnia pulex TaxID=6669 RepID=E9GAM1_DAPPU|nr:hypothetical protein DAPPUDRAFT_315729 [Daphnia pulex]|eukprot:EFX83274.1 hypothetical protein DAPPUDRAFT_315729 [Daphnia pulex]
MDPSLTPDRLRGIVVGGVKRAEILCGQLLCFFKEQEDFAESKAAASPLNLYQAVCERASNYTKRKNVFRLRTSDGAEFHFSAEDQQHLDDWVKKISFHACLSPAQQLMSYDTYQAKSSLSVNPPASLLVIPTKSKTPAKEVKRNLSSIASMEAKADTEEDFHSADSGSDSDSYKKRSPDAKGPKSNKSSPSASAPPKKPQESQVALVEPTVQAAPPVLPRTSAPSRQPFGDEVWIKVNNAASAKGLQ